MNNDVDSEIQNKIFYIILKNPGLYLSKISELCNMDISSVEKHIFHMENNKRIYSIEKSGSKRYYTNISELKIREKKSIDIRNKIYDVITKNPGLHLSKIAEMINIRTSLAEYHLFQLEKDNKIISVKEPGGYYKRYFTTKSGLGSDEKNILALLRHEVPLKILLFLLNRPKFRHRDILNNLNITSSTLSYHINKLVAAGIIDVKSYGDEKGYIILNKKKIKRLLLKYEIHTIFDDFEDTWVDLEY